MRHLAISSEPHRTSHSPFPLHHLCSFHADSQLAHLVTTDTYLFLLRRAYAVSNYKLAEHLLTELTDRGFSRNDEAIVRLVHRYALKRGNGQLAFEERQRLKSQGLAALECLNSRRDLLEDGKGQGDAIVTWKGRERGRVPRKRRVFYETLRSSTSSSGGKKHNVKAPMGTPDSHHVIDRLSTLFQRAPSTRSPSDVTKLASVDIATLVDSYVLDRNAQRAFESARVWLDHTRRGLINTHANLNANPTTTRPTTVATSPPLPPDLARQTHHLQACRSYEQTALVLLNILLKSLYASRVSTTSIRTFVLTYLDQHSLPQRWKLRPALATLRTLVVGNTGYHGSWGRSVKLVAWFDQQFGPIERLELEWVQGPKHHFARRACVRADASVTYLLLGLAIKDQKRKRDKEGKMKGKVREWWKEVEEVRKDRGWNGLQGGKGKQRIKEAKELGLIEVEEIKGKVRQEVKK
ncbi:BZ3500_MvSof-1268-A1-R1_Chr5-2g07899 [Microbotryum saponariae]|uniref:BZ3500_MvSof-1268-A1-R1_Chr5-2g07899 protein n=1 Tax=Microbotryum saponariae TaxID=289078 RepID=A0A2X0LKT6_9BASI|nr:BZ3500_MvSof-1268-A1-R1_Chr5-2g07899 [Microbotryum saponariae]SDA05768.1 BZ3501_MvSof-1269-A2-R1_Chr5-2g07721 [Microbotryum saponariae]